MRYRHSTVRVALAILVIAPLLCIGGTVAAVIAADNAREREIAAAEARWRTRGFVHYVMVLEELNCMVEIEVFHRRVVRVKPLERCQRDGRTVEDLFALARRDGDTGMRCITLGCACDDRLSVESIFHPHLGYPTSIYVQIEAQPNWRHPDAWHYLITRGRLPACNMMKGDKLLRVVSLRSLP
ncbi:MAG: hypothetical protein RMJ55_00610 [Roseiflexaceae bacterium]|nr:hypothetical protein [Roseiflexus sp.]MDW8212031.1 hypothetical protein [Roseiflexaceae bacterium]